MGIIARIKGEEPNLLLTVAHGMRGKGHLGEYLIDYALNHDNVKGRLVTYANLIVPNSNGKVGTAEIDVLMLHEKGIFIFESKNYSGWIFGSADQVKWTASLNRSEKNRFYNPIKQNRTHVGALSRYLGLSTDLFMSYIVFSERCELKKVPPDTGEYRILRRHHLLRDLRADLKSREVLFDEAAFAELQAKLDALAASSTKDAAKAHAERANRLK